uniref:Uncharacterized protein AlNc14C300G10364 n=1 Tax=Albugo laibachii Nc14 TaxID=890382 RepID=F0WVM7_9STRA|nr:conserved hypothetical protein [Albugo laibachii Nc14]|eukprot:CCA25471.1 conserved hypothetical protein [Albugo laibachii Nc14]
MPRGRKRSPGGQGRQKTKYSRANDTYRKKLDVINHLFQINDMQWTLEKFYGHLTPDKRETKRKLIYTWAKQRTHIEDMCRVITGASQKSTREIGMATVISREGEEVIKLWVNYLRREGIPISALMLQLNAQSVAEDEGVLSDVFTGSWSWRKLFLKRHGLSFRTRTRQG